MLVLTEHDVSEITATFTPDFLTELMARAFGELSSKSCVNPVRSTIASELQTTLFMPARLLLDGTAIKVVSVPSVPMPRGLPATTLVIDDSTGAVKAVVNARNLTALRNAAGSLLATRLIGPVAPRQLVTFGAGNQIRAHIQLFIRAFSSIEMCTIVTRTRNERVINQLRAQFSSIGFANITSAYDDDKPLDSYPELEEALARANIVICATPAKKPLFRSTWIARDTHVILIGSFTKEMHEVQDALVHRACPILVDSRTACLEEAGEVISSGLGFDDLVEIGELVNSEGRLPRKDGSITMFKSVGVAVQDVAIASAVVKKAYELLGKGDRIGVQIADYD